MLRMTRVLLVRRRDEPGGWMRPIVDSSRLPSPPQSSAPPSDSDFVDYGYFNVDLASMPRLSLVPGEYSVAVSLLGDLSSWETFQIE